MLNKLKKNDEVMTSGGIYGKVIYLKDHVVTLEVAPNVRIRVNRPQISTVITTDKTPAKEGKDNRCDGVSYEDHFLGAALSSVIFFTPTFFGKR